MPSIILDKGGKVMTNKSRMLEILKQTQAVISDSHFIYTSGKHGSVFVRKDRIYPHTQLTSEMCQMIAQEVKDLKIDVVVGPSLCGIVLSQWVAYHLSILNKQEILSVFTEKSTDEKQMFDRPQVFKRGYDALVAGKNVLVVEDLTTTGASVKKVVDQVRLAEGKVICVYVLVNRNPEGVNESLMGAPFKSLAVVKAEAYEEASCPLCKKGVPINTEVGHGAEYLKEKKNIK
jgi:orotate phosphoribosyltransferase